MCKYTEEANFTQKLEEKKQAFGNKSEGIFSSFGYYPIIFLVKKLSPASTPKSAKRF